MSRLTQLLLQIGFMILFIGNPFAQKSPDLFYLGEKVCRECHHLSGNRDQFNAWRLSKHSRSYAALFKPEAKKIAELSGIKIKPYESSICLGCHTTAFFTQWWQRNNDFHFEDGIQCELCHGAGSAYLKIHSTEDLDKATEAGLWMPEKYDCMICHKEKSSHLAVLKVEKFNYEDALQKITHIGLGGPLGNTLDSPNLAGAGSRYVGSLVCGECHSENSSYHEYGQWRFSQHAQAYAVLGTEEARQIAGKIGITEPQKSDQCLNCHTTGAGESADRFSDSFDFAQGVQCESCHGAGSEYISEAVMRDSLAASKAGLQQINEKVCRECHIEDIHGYGFNFEKYFSEIDHAQWLEKSNDSLDYKNPINMTITRDGRRLYVVCEVSNTLIVVDLKSDKILAEVEVGMQPHFVCLSPDEAFAYVSNRGSDDVSVIDTKTLQILANLPVGDEPHEVVTNSEGNILYVANAGSYNVSVIDLDHRKEIKRLAASRGAWGLSRSPDGQLIYVSNNLAKYGPFRSSSISEVTVIETRSSTVKYRYQIPDANLLQGIDVSPDGEFVLITLIRTKSLVPMTRTIQGWIITNGIGVLWKDGRVDQLLLDEINDFFADPTDLVFSKDGQFAFVSGGGVQEVAMIDIKSMKKIITESTEADRKNILPNHLGLSPEFVVVRIPVGKSPRGMVVSPDNKYLYVADGLDDDISVIDIKARKRKKVIDLGGPKYLTQARVGEHIFHDAQYTFNRQFSCHSCHPDGHIDGIVYDIEPDGLGINPVDNRTLRGINDTAPFKWTGKNPSLKRQCGARLAAFFTRIDPFTLEQSAALDRYIVTISRPPNRYLTQGELSPTQLRGKYIFERQYDSSGNKIPPINRCIYCHAPPYYTNREKFDVGTASWLDTQGNFDVPHLNNIYDSSPYLHDGRAQSLDRL
jgi:YVTN family beta-propeller protein